MNSKNQYLQDLEAIIEERKKAGEPFYDYEKERVLSPEEYYDAVFFEMKRLSDSIFSDEDYYEEQFCRYNSFRDYINDIINDITKEDLAGKCHL